MNHDEYEAARVVATFGHRAHEIHRELQEAYEARDGARGGRLCQEMHAEPDLLMLVVSLLLTSWDNATKTGVHSRLATPEELGVDFSNGPEPWQIAENDQIEAAGEREGTVAYARLSADAWLKAIQIDLLKHKREEGYFPDMQFVLRGTMLAEHGVLALVAAELMHRLAMAKIEEG